MKIPRREARVNNNIVKRGNAQTFVAFVSSFPFQLPLPIYVAWSLSNIARQTLIFHRVGKRKRKREKEQGNGEIIVDDLSKVLRFTLSRLTRLHGSRHRRWNNSPTVRITFVLRLNLHLAAIWLRNSPRKVIAIQY